MKFQKKTTHISNNFSTSSGVTNLCTKMSGGLVLSINLLRKSRFMAGPGMKYDLLATPCQKKRLSVGGNMLCRKEYPRTTSSSSAGVFSFRVVSASVFVTSLDVLIARFARSPMGTASSGYGSMSDSTRVFGETGPSSEPDDGGRC